MQNFITEEMGKTYSKFLREELGIGSDLYWRGLVQSPEVFKNIDTCVLSSQVNAVSRRFRELGKNILLLPPTFSPKNLKAYLNAEWEKMSDLYQECMVPWTSIDVTASGDIAPCHIFYDLTMGNLHEQSFGEIWNNEKYLKFRSFMREHKFMSICPGCCILYLAGKRLRRKKKT